MGRMYSVPFDAISITGGEDLFELIPASNKPILIHEVVVGQDSDYGDTQAEGLRVLIKRATGSYTTGSGGSTPTPSKHVTADAAAGFTAKTGNTTPALPSAGALATVRAEVMNVQSGYQYLPIPEDRIIFVNGEACVVSLFGGTGTGGPADALVVSGTVVVEELG